MNTVTLCSQLKSFCQNVQHDCDKMKRSVSSRSNNLDNFGSSEDNFLNALEEQLEAIQRDLLTIETSTFGPIEARLSYVSIEEFNAKFSKLLEANASLIKLVSSHASCCRVELSTNNNNITTKPESIQAKIIHNNENEIIDANRLLNVNDNDEQSNEYIISTNDDKPTRDTDYSTLSPINNNTLENQEFSKTPTLADWKLSEATRTLVQRDTISGKGGNHFNSDGSPLSNDIESSFSIMNVSSMAATTNASTNFNPTTPHVKTLFTGGGKDYYSDSDGTPATPELGTPLNTCILRGNRFDDIIGDRDGDDDASPATSDGNIATLTPLLKPDHAHRDVLLVSTQKIAFQVDDDSDCDQSMNSNANSLDISPLKVAKLLQPRVFNSSDASGWIPLVSEKEWSSSPAFLQKQLKLEGLNVAIESLNTDIAAQQKNSGSGSSGLHNLISYSQDELYRLLEGVVGVDSLKPIVMAIVYHKRLDISTEGGVKHYKVKRYY